MEVRWTLLSLRTSYVKTDSPKMPNNSSIFSVCTSLVLPSLVDDTATSPVEISDPVVRKGLRLTI